MKNQLQLVLLMLLCVVSSAFSAGGWSIVSVDDAGVVDAGSFASRETYKTNYVSHRVISAQQQVVAGMNYKLRIDTTISPDNACKSNDFIVWNRFGEKQITSSEEHPCIG
jgi:Cystatin domain